jgi:RNA polymerase sigma factor (sigma-70 family)
MAMPDATKSLSDPALAERIAQLGAHSEFIENLCAQANVARFGFTAATFVSHLARSAASRFKGVTPSAQELEAYLCTLCLEDFALACACSEGQEAAWDFFVKNYRGYLRRCAGVMLRCAAESPEASDLADSLFAELYGFADGRRGASSLFRYFHGRSALKTWLRAVLAQRHVDGIRAARRFDSLDEEDGVGRLAAADGASGAERREKNSITPSTEPPLGPLAIAPDPYREKYIALFCRALQEALRQLDAADRRRVCLYYVESKTLAEVGRLCGEHESSVSRNLERIRRGLRVKVEEDLRRGAPVNKGANAEGAGGQGLSDAQVALCLQYATEDTPIDFDLLFPSDLLLSDDKSAQPGIIRRDKPRENS